jgi:Protein of unknown function (DUF707)
MSGRVLVLGVFMADRENLAAGISSELGRSLAFRVEQRWVALGTSAVPAELDLVTAFRQASPLPKFTILNRLLSQGGVADFDYLVVVDDDIELPHGFLDRYLELVERHDLALAQPARTHDSYIDHAFVEQLDGLDARWTRFVEIGPLFSIRRDAVALLTPFDEGSPMGWGYDLAWPVTMEQAGLRLGIVDATPVRHRLRKPVSNYDSGAAARAMAGHLAGRAHLDRSAAFTILESWVDAP